MYLHIFRSNFHLHQTVNRIVISVGCYSSPIIEHEFLHTIGIYHTQVNISEKRVLLELLWQFKIILHSNQSRSDRDSYVKIIWSNIPEDKKYNFRKYSETVVNHFNLSYDFEVRYGNKIPRKEYEHTMVFKICY